jgi:hypothetical protein
VKVLALDAAQPFDFEARMQSKVAHDKQLKIGIVGFGTFGQFLARRMIDAGHRWGGVFGGGGVGGWRGWAGVGFAHGSSCEQTLHYRQMLSRTCS